MNKGTLGKIRADGAMLFDSDGTGIAVLLGAKDVYTSNAIRMAVCWNHFNNLEEEDHPDKVVFDHKLSLLAEKNKKLKKLLEEIGSYENQNENIRSLIDRELGIKKWITYPVWEDEK